MILFIYEDFNEFLNVLFKNRKIKIDISTNNFNLQLIYTNFMINRISLLSALLIVCSTLKTNAQKTDPPFWWTNMPRDQLQLMVYDDNIGEATASINQEGIEITRQSAGDSRNYLFLYLNISNKAPAGTFSINFSNGKSINYELRQRENDPSKNQGFDSEDVIYLLMPDRFANGNTNNDSFADMLEKADRSDPNGRHGGDIAGIKDKLVYIKELGMTAVWTTPVFENDMTPEYGAYHGYAATDLYKIDRRFGTNEEYKNFVKTCHNNDIKVIMDMIHNHIGDQHPWLKDPPTNDWFHSIEKYGTTNYRGAAQNDPHASQYDMDKLQKAWFVPSMPDLNQKNELLADYLIQNTIWWIEYSGIDGIRMDTYVYPYKDYMRRWAKEVLEAYPNFNVVGEAWVQNPASESFWQEDKEGQNDGYNSYLPSVTDFPFQYGVRDAMNQDFGWTSGLAALYYTLTQDHLYSDPMKNVIFLDNHDLERFFTVVNENKEKFKIAYNILMTMRGIPQVYYGTELMLANDKVDGDGRKRPDMKGGWPGDERSVFLESGRIPKENEAFEHVKKITNWRKNAKAIHDGKLTHFVPEDNIYVYFRHTKDEKVMVVVNMNPESKNLALNRFDEFLKGHKNATDIMTQKSNRLGETMEVPGMSANIYEIR